MSNYTTQTASIKATTIDTRKIDTKQIDTKTLNINGISIDEKLKQAAIASRGNLMAIQFQQGISGWCVIFVKDGQVLDEQISCACGVGGLGDLGDDKKQYLQILYRNGDGWVFNERTTVNKVLGLTLTTAFEIKLKEVLI